MLVSVVIPTINEAEWIRAAVASVRRDYTDNEVEIIVVDGGSVDGTPRLVPDGEVVIESAPGRAIQMNRGARVAAGDILVFCHADTLVPPSWREAVVEVLRRPGASVRHPDTPDRLTDRGARATDGNRLTKAAALIHWELDKAIFRVTLFGRRSDRLTVSPRGHTVSFEPASDLLD